MVLTNHQQKHNKAKMMKPEYFMLVLHELRRSYILFIERKDSMNTNLYSFMNDKQAEDFIDKLNKQAAKHLVKLGVGKDWKKIYEGMKRRRKKRERST